ncbi:MAG: hypothetical protein HYX47_19945 [Burkholderiales bacterium]|nr:hypothetical protein [Burkholderiales bacterium]
MGATTRPVAWGTSLGFESVFQQSLGDAMAQGRWQGLMASMGADMAESVRQTLAGVSELARSKRIGVHEARWLQEPLMRLYQTGVSAQKLSRLVDRAGTTAQETVSLDELVADAVSHHQQRSPSHRIVADLTMLDVQAEPEALASAMDSLLVWGINLGRDVNVRLVRERGAARGELWLRVSELNDRAHDDRQLNSVDWYVLWQLARLKGVKVKRKVEADRIRVMVQFARVMSQHSGMAVLEVGPAQEEVPAFDPDVTEVWCVMPRGNLSVTAITALRPHVRNLKALTDLRSLADSTLVPDCVVSTTEFLDTEAFRHWRRCAQEVRGRTIAVVEVTAVANVFDVGGFGSRSMARVSASTVRDKLLSAIVFELSHVSGDGH